MIKDDEAGEETSDLDLVWGAQGIAQAINRTPRQVHYLVSTGALPVKKLGKQWCISRSALKSFFDAKNVEGSVA